MSVTRPCPECGGDGTTIGGAPCLACGATGRVPFQAVHGDNGVLIDGLREEIARLTLSAAASAARVAALDGALDDIGQYAAEAYQRAGAIVLDDVCNLDGAQTNAILDAFVEITRRCEAARRLLERTPCPSCGSADVACIEVPAFYDGGLYWLCDACGARWHRWPEGDWRRERAELYVTGREGP